MTLDRRAPDSALSSSPRRSRYDAVVVGSGPNGLAAAIALAERGASVVVIEGHEQLGGGTRTAPLTLPGYAHDVCSAVHPLALASPLFRDLPLADHGLTFVHPDVPLAHPLDDGSAAVLCRDVDATARSLGRDGVRYRRTFAPLVDASERLFDDVLAPLRMPSSPLVLARFGLHALRSASSLARGWFHDDAARALFAGNAAHSMRPLDAALTGAVGLMLQVSGHAVGWPFARGGSQAIADAMARYLQSLGGEVVTGTWVNDLDELPSSRVVLLDVAPPGFARMAGARLPAGYAKRLARYRFGPGAFKMDFALHDPIPWRAEGCRRAGTVHVGGTLEELEASERACWAGEISERPFVLVSQPSLFDPTRAPPAKHTAWAYCHVPHGSVVDVSAHIVGQIERFAPGFRDRVVATSVRTPADLERENPNYVGGDIVAGVQDLGQLFTRPVARWNPYSTPLDGVFLCSASTPPGPGVHGMCGFFAAAAAAAHLER